MTALLAFDFTPQILEFQELALDLVYGDSYSAGRKVILRSLIVPQYLSRALNGSGSSSFDKTNLSYSSPG